MGEDKKRSEDEIKELKEKLKRLEEKQTTAQPSLLGSISTVIASLGKLAEQGEINSIKEFQTMEGMENKRAVWGISVRPIIGGKNRIQRFGNVKIVGGRTVVEDKREPLVDIFDEEKQIRITAELPGVEKKDITIELTENQLVISVDREERRYYKKIPIKTHVEIAGSNYKNGVLEIRLNKKGNK